MNSENIQSMEFGASPSFLDFELNNGGIVCRNLSIFSSIDKLDLKIEDYWDLSENHDKNLSNYVFSAEDAEIIIDYSKELRLNRSRIFPVCVSVDKEKFAKGILLLNAPNGNLNIGVWLNIGVPEKGTGRRSLISGFVSDGLMDNEVNVPYLLGFLILSSLALFIVLLFLTIKVKGRME